MKLQRNKTYTSDNSDLAVLILSVDYVGSDYTKVKIALYNKNNPDIIYERGKRYKLYHNNISHWKLLGNEAK